MKMEDDWGTPISLNLQWCLSGVLLGTNDFYAYSDWDHHKHSETIDGVTSLTKWYDWGPKVPKWDGIVDFKLGTEM